MKCGLQNADPAGGCGREGSASLRLGSRRFSRLGFPSATLNQGEFLDLISYLKLDLIGIKMESLRDLPRPGYSGKI